MNGEQTFYRTIPPEKVVKYVILAVIGVVVLAVISTSFYTIQPDEQGVVQRFGKFVRLSGPGLHFKLPGLRFDFPLNIETVKVIPVTRKFKEEFGFRTLKAGIKSTFASQKLPEESLMLCGDLNVANVKWSVRYIISKPKNFLFMVRDPRKIIRDVSESVMREAIGDSSVDEVLSDRRNDINIEVKNKMQRILDLYAAGILIDDITLQEVTPPDEVKSAFNEVNTAQQDKERFRREAEKEYNMTIFRADGEAKQMIQQAKAYAIDRTNTAKGDAQRFTQIWQEYKQNKDVTRRRLYLESLGRVLPNLEKKYIIDDEIKSLLPLMKIGGE